MSEWINAEINYSWEQKVYLTSINISVDVVSVSASELILKFNLPT